MASNIVYYNGDNIHNSFIVMKIVFLSLIENRFEYIRTFILYAYLEEYKIEIVTDETIQILYVR